MLENLSLRRAGVADAAAVAWHRAAMFRDMGEVSGSDFDLLLTASEAWLAQRLASGEYLGWVVEEGHSKRIVAGGGLLLREMWPVPGCPRPGRWAHIGNVYTEPTFRRNGLARLVMQAILDWCRANEVDHITLAASGDGRPLYVSLGFQADGKGMKWPPRSSMNP